MTRNRIVALLLLGLGLIVMPTDAMALTPAEIAEKAIPSIVQIRFPDGVGTGFVVSDDGRIVTNAHVLQLAGQAKVITADGREFEEIELLATDELHDLAVLRIASIKLKGLELGDSSTAKPGEHVVVIGNPLGFGNTVSDGLISAVRELAPGQSMLQISAPISPGSSGGPLFSDRGEVIGVSTLVISGGQNLNFAVPINVLKPLLASNKGIPLASYEPPNRIRRKVPTHSSDFLNQCPVPQRQAIVAGIEQAIKLGAPLYNKGNIEACYRIYAAAALDASRKVEDCPGPKRALLEGVDNADRLSGWNAKAWAMRDAFDGVLAASTTTVDERTSEVRSGSARPIPWHDGSVFKDCTPAAIDDIASRIAATIDSGAPLYNSGEVEACFLIYDGAVSDIDRRVEGCAAAKQALQDGARAAGQVTSWQEKSWALRDAFDGLTQAIDRRRAGSGQ